MKVGRNLAKVRRAVEAAGLLVARGLCRTRHHGGRAHPAAGDCSESTGAYFAMVLIPGRGEAAVSGSLDHRRHRPGQARADDARTSRGACATRPTLSAMGPISRACRRSRPISAATPPTIGSNSSARGMRCRSPPRAATSSSFRAAIPACSPWRRPCSKRSRRASPAWRTLDIRVEPGVTAMLAAAAEVGRAARRRFLRHLAFRQSQVLGDHRAAAEGCSRGRLRHRALQSRLARRGRISWARRSMLLRRWKSGRHAGAVRARGRNAPTPQVVTTTLGAADASRADMRTLVIVGASTTRARSAAGSIRRAASEQRDRDRANAEPLHRAVAHGRGRPA